MTAQPEQDTGPIYQLPERVPLDALSAASLRVMEALDEQMTQFPDVMIALDPRKLAQAALEGIDGLPRVPAWVPEQPRSIGGGTRPDSVHPDPVVTVNGPSRPDYVQVLVEATCEHDATVEATLEVMATDAEQWFLAGLAAVAASRHTEDRDPA